MMTFLFFFLANLSLQKVSFEMNVEKWLNSALKLSQQTSEHDRKIQRCKNNKCLIFNGIPSKNRQYFWSTAYIIVIAEVAKFFPLSLGWNKCELNGRKMPLQCLHVFGQSTEETLDV